jgi:phage terminase large subunit GpA-like protein
MITAPAPQTSAQPALLFPFRFSGPEREVFRAKEDLRISQWAEKSIYVPRGAHVGMYRNEFNPYGVDVMDTWRLPHVREVNVCAPPQAMKTIIAHCCMGNSIPNDPCEMMLVMPTRDEVREEMDDRIIPMIENSPVLSKIGRAHV